MKVAGRVGIDVGGTFTDAVLMQGNRILDKAKVPTKPDNLLETIIQAMDALKITRKQPLEQITVSTTLVTNAILQGNLPPVDLLLLPGNGVKLESFPWPISYQILYGSIDYRGREINPPDQLEWQRLLQKLHQQKNLSHVAIVGKFSHRNKSHEELLAHYLRRAFPTLKIALGHQWGQSNFYRRSLTTYLNLASNDLFGQFAADLEQAVAARGCRAPIFVLKADGGVLPLAKIRPVESIYSGPTASVLGAMAQSSPSQSFVMIDIGGTTTDLGLVLSGEPLISSSGAKIGPYSTLVRSLAVRSVPVGGDSVILTDGSNFSLANYRLGPAYCLGGPAPTPTDAMCYLKLIQYGDSKRAEQVLASLLQPENRTPEKLRALASSILDVFVERIVREINALQQEWQNEPAYKVWGVLHPHESLKFHLWMSGGGAQGIASVLAQRLHTSVRMGKYPEVSNAIGAAMARPTFSCTLHLDTVLRQYRIEETGEQGQWQGAKRPHQEVNGFLEEIVQREAQEKGIVLMDLHKDPFDFFPIVQGFQTVGQIVRGAFHVPPGVIGRVEE